MRLHNVELCLYTYTIIKKEARGIALQEPLCPVGEFAFECGRRVFHECLPLGRSDNVLWQLEIHLSVKRPPYVL